MSSATQSFVDSLPPALRRDQVVKVFRCYGVGGRRIYEDLVAVGTLKPLRGLPGAKLARFSKEQVLSMCVQASSLPPST